MGKGRITALLIAVVVIGLALMRTATANHTTDHFAFSGGATFKGLVAKTDRAVTSITSVAPNWTVVDSRGFQIPAGESQLVAVDFSAETFCEGAGDFCAARVLIGRTLATADELEPAGGGNFALDFASFDDIAEGHAMNRALCVRNATASPLNVSVWLQATNSGVSVANYQLSMWALKIARNAPCSPSVPI